MKSFNLLRHFCRVDPSHFCRNRENEESALQTFLSVNVWCASLCEIVQSFNRDSAAMRIRLSTLETCTDLMNLEGSSTDSRVLFRTELIFPPTAALIFRAFSVFAGFLIVKHLPKRVTFQPKSGSLQWNIASLDDFRVRTADWCSS